VRIGAAGGIGIRNSYSTDRLMAIDGQFRLLLFVVQAIEPVGVAMPPAIDADRGDVAPGIETVSPKDARQLVNRA